jgi:phenylacetate-coenzyme A ligase PaaK-like adenylate-forming protein
MDLRNSIHRNLIYPALLAASGAWMYRRLEELELSQYWSPEQLEALQLEKLNRLLKHARDTVAFYRARIPRTITSLRDLAQIPVLTKEDVRTHYSALVSKRPHGRVSRKITGGSTGAPVTIAKSSAGLAGELASMWRGYGWAGIHVGDRQARFWGVPRRGLPALRARLIDVATNRIRLSAFAFEDRDLSRFTSRLSRFRPDYFYGYVSAIRAYANYFVRRGLTPPTAPTAIITTSEVLGDSDRRTLSSIFGSPVYDEYGCGEVGSIAHECERGALHICCENLVLETVQEDGQPMPAGHPGDVLVTDLSNYAMPLVRYRLGDRATLKSARCSCGRGLPVIAAVHGREYDIIRNWKGQRFHGEFFLYIAEDARKAGLSVSGYQIEQAADRELIIRLVCDGDQFDGLSAYMAARIHKDFDADCRIAFSRVDRIAREPSGKLRVVKGSRIAAGDHEP